MRITPGMVGGAWLAFAFSGPAAAGAWPIPAGETLTILKFEPQSADTAFNAAQVEVPISERRDDSVTLWVERGLTDSLTFQGKAAYGQGRDGVYEYDGRGPVEFGLRQVVFRRKQAVVSLYAGAVFAGESRGGFTPPGAGDGDLELRLLMGNSRTLFGKRVFEEVQIARLARRKLPNEMRMDTTFGVHLNRNWTLMTQTYAGQADTEIKPWWFKAEASVVRNLGRWKLQAGWRRTLAGREVPADGGPVFAVWRTF